ncbi:MAG: glycosyltransferase [Salibacteraceae bacterium]
MNIGIIGTRGIPNRYGGFEQYVEYLAPELVKRGHSVTVYNPAHHPNRDTFWKGVKIVRKPDPQFMGSFSQFIYDLACILHSRSQHYDLILQLGYTSSSIWSRFFPSTALVVTNMDGLEWMRTKYSPPVKRFLKWAEGLAVKHSDYLIADSPGIRVYLLRSYGVDSKYIAYGTEIFDHPNEDVIARLGLDAYQYDMLIARIEPENNVDVIIEAHVKANSNRPLLVIGNHKATALGRYLYKRFSAANVRFMGPIYDMEVLNNLRFYSNLYFHGHSVGGTNPSLLEAMASGALICASDNPFNRAVLRDAGLYFKGVDDLVDLIEKEKKNADDPRLAGIRKIVVENYTWPKIIDETEAFLMSILKSRCEA